MANTRRNLHVTFQPHTSISTSTTNSVSVSLQAQFEVLPKAVDVWRLARSNLSSEAKANVRAEHVHKLVTNGKIPAWTLDQGPIPGYAEPFLDEVIRLKRMQALELLNLTQHQLLLRATMFKEIGTAHLTTCQTLYGEDQGFTRAKDLLATLVGRDKAETITSLNKRYDQISEKPVSDDAITLRLVRRNQPSATNSRQASRSRSRSNSRNRPDSTTDRENQAPQRSNTRPPKGRGRGRGGNNRQRSNSRGRGNKGNSNRRPRQRSNSRPRNRQYDSLSAREQRLIDAYRNDNGQ